MNVVGQGVPKVHCKACSRCCGQCLDNRPGLGAHLQIVSVFVRLFLETMHQERYSRLDKQKVNDVGSED